MTGQASRKLTVVFPKANPLTQDASREGGVHSQVVAAGKQGGAEGPVQFAFVLAALCLLYPAQVQRC